ncbi:GNAT family N-acetyltransferase [Spiroplasma gladiatoris]|uniref:GNAT family N-acetyltransferase n=1 Tax=Spiroplasma gladiatoris TaxID=2143 RepID=A0A4P7AK04_9MOLU|nr:GNAT family N-acetyltransferase [Spiroplasma gladiatoris]QBQ07890.1 GNAT family N-acetyltransferase [Spiroplasma gladiatoris]
MKIDFKIEKGKNNDVFNDAIKLRYDIFVVEQECYSVPDQDEIDDYAYHIVGYNNNEVICCARVFYKDEILRWGRIAVKIDYRKNNLGLILLDYLKEFSINKMNAKTVNIHAQCYAANFYKKIGFVECGDKFIEDEIEHIEMNLSLI